MADFKRPRRYYLRKRLYYARLPDVGMASVWQSKQEAEPGTSLPASFPMLSTLQACGYKTVEDLDGADAEELAEIGLSTRQATAVLAALADLV